MQLETVGEGKVLGVLVHHSRTMSHQLWKRWDLRVCMVR